MRRPLIAGVVLAAALAALPLAGHAATAPSITLITPTAGDAANGQVTVRWSFSGFSNTTPVDVEVGRDGIFTRIARVPIDEGTPGYRGSTAWDTTAFEDATDYVVRVTVVVRKSANSSASGLTVDNTGPTSTVDAEPATDPAPVAAVLADVTGSADDALSNVASVAVTFVAADGTETAAAVVCDCNASSTTWSASTAGLDPGSYEVRAVATDALGNVGEEGTATITIVAQPTVDPGTITGPIEDVVATLPDPVETVNEVVGTLPTVDPETVRTALEELIATLPTVDPGTAQTAVEEAITTLPVDPSTVQTVVEGILGTIPPDTSPVVTAVADAVGTVGTPG